MKVDIQDVSFRYDQAQLLFNGLKLVVESGRCLGIVGPSGCGKSTLLRIICGLFPRVPTHRMSGTVLLNHQEPAAAIAQGLVGFVFQEPTLLPHLSVRANVALPLAMLRRTLTGGDPIAALLSSVGLADRSESLPHQLSTGMKTRVMLARAFSTAPALLLMDEPFAALDIGWRFKLYADLEALRRSATITTVIVSHDIPEALVLCDEIIVLSPTGEKMAHVMVPGPRPHSFDLDTISAFLEQVQQQYISLLGLFLATKGTATQHPSHPKVIA